MNFARYGIVTSLLLTLDALVGCTSTGTAPQASRREYKAPGELLSFYSGRHTAWVQGLYIAKPQWSAQELCQLFKDAGYSQEEAEKYSQILSQHDTIVIAQDAKNPAEALKHERIHRGLSHLSDADKNLLQNAYKDIAGRVYTVEQARSTGYFDEDDLFEAESFCRDVNSGKYNDVYTPSPEDQELKKKDIERFSRIHLLRSRHPKTSFILGQAYDPADWQEPLVRLAMDEFKPSALRAMQAEHPRAYELLRKVQEAAGNSSLHHH